LKNLRLQKSNISAALKCRTITEEERKNLLAEREITDGNISLMTDGKKSFLQSQIAWREEKRIEKNTK
jgi:hypothetical protein